MKLCKSCARTILAEAKMWVKGEGLDTEDWSYATAPDSDCEFWAHRQMNASAANLNEVIDRAFHDEGKAVVAVAKLREIWRGLGGGTEL